MMKKPTKKHLKFLIKLSPNIVNSVELRHKIKKIKKAKLLIIPMV